MSRPCADCTDPAILGCACCLEDSDTIDFSGTGEGEHCFTGDVRLDPAADNRITASAAGLYVAGTVPSARISRSNAQTIENDSEEQLTYNTTDWDTDGLAGSGVSLIVQTPGIYLVGGRSGFTPDGSGSRGLVLYKDATEIDSIYLLNNGGGHSWLADVGGYPEECLAGVELTLTTTQDSGAQLDTATGKTRLWAVWVSDLP